MRHAVRQLLHLATIVETGSLSAAADALNLTQPALSRSVRQLEELVGGRLFERTRHGTEPTALGLALATHARNIDASLQRAADEIDAWHNDRTGRLIVGATAVPAFHFVPDAIAGFVRDRPRLSIRFRVHGQAALSDLLREGAIDLFVGSVDPEAGDPSRQQTVLLDDRLDVLAGRHHPLLRRRKVTATDLTDYSWVLPPPDAPLRRQMDAALVEAGATGLHVAVETENTAAVMPLLQRTDYLTLHSARLLAPAIEAGQIATVPVRLAGMRRPLAVYHRSDAEQTPLEAAFIACLVTHAKTLGG